jgi:hypothetical protein
MHADCSYEYRMILNVHLLGYLSDEADEASSSLSVEGRRLLMTTSDGALYLSLVIGFKIHISLQSLSLAKPSVEATLHDRR